MKQNFSLNFRPNFHNDLQEQSETAYVHQGYGLDLKSVSRYGLQIRTPDSNYFQNVMGTSLSKDTSLHV